MSFSSSSDRISASGRVVRVAPGYVYVHSDAYGSIFAHPSAVTLGDEEEKATPKNLMDILRVDDIVHFVAAPQNGPNGCRWMAVKITTKFPHIPSPVAKEDSSITDDEMSKLEHFFKTDQETSSSPVIIKNVVGTILDIYERHAFIHCDKYGRIYFPMAAAATALKDYEIYPLNFLFSHGEPVIFDAQRQPTKNDCHYAAVRVQYFSKSTEETTNETDQKISKISPKQIRDEIKEIETSNISYETGEISRIFPQYGFIRSEKIGTVFFTLAHYEGTYGKFASVDNLSDELELGDRVRFVPVAQTEKNGCRWRGLKVTKIGSEIFCGISEAMDDDFSTDGDAEKSKEIFVCEISTQTDQSLWNSFVLQQTIGGRRKIGGKNTENIPSKDEACQTVMPPEVLLLKAVKEDPELREVLRERFPHLMKFIDKNT